MKIFNGQFIYKTREEQTLVESDLSKYGMFPVERLFTSIEWFQFASLAPKLRPIAVAAKLRNHPKYIAKEITYTRNGEVYKMLVVDKSTGKVTGCLSLEDVCRITHYTGANYRDEAEQLQKVKENREVIINESHSTASPVEPTVSDKETKESAVATTKDDSSVPDEQLLYKIRIENALSLCPLPNTSFDNLGKQCAVFRHIYKDFDRVLKKIGAAASNDRDFSPLAEYMSEVSELASVTLCTFARDPKLFSDFKAARSQWAPNQPQQSYTNNAAIAAILMDPETPIESIAEMLPNVKFRPFAARKFYASPNALLYAVDLFARNRVRAIDEQVPNADIKFMSERAKCLGNELRGGQGSTFREVVDSILKSPLRNFYPTYYNSLIKRDILDPTGQIVSSRIKSNIISEGPKWLSLEFSSLRNWIANPIPAINTERIDELEVNF